MNDFRGSAFMISSVTGEVPDLPVWELNDPHCDESTATFENRRSLGAPGRPGRIPIAGPLLRRGELLGFLESYVPPANRSGGTTGPTGPTGTVVLNLSGMADEMLKEGGKSVSAAQFMSHSGRRTPPWPQWPAGSAWYEFNIDMVPHGSVDLLVCDSGWLNKINPELLSGQNGQNGESADSTGGRAGGMAGDLVGEAGVWNAEGASCSCVGGMTGGIDAGGTVALSADGAAGVMVDTVESIRGHELQHKHLKRVFEQFSSIVTSSGICVLVYQHLLASAWLLLGQTLAASDWRCRAVVPSPAQMPEDPYLHSRTLRWNALLLCGRRDRRGCGLQGPRGEYIDRPGILDGFEVSATSEATYASPAGVRGMSEYGGSERPVVIDSDCPDRAALLVAEFCKTIGTRRWRVGQADRLNLWRALVAAGAEVGDPVPGTMLLTNVLASGPADPGWD